MLWFSKREKLEDALVFVDKMATGGLREVRDAILLAYDANVIDAEEFFVLYEENRSRELFPYWKADNFDLGDWDKTKLRFAKNDLNIARWRFKGGQP